MAQKEPANILVELFQLSSFFIYQDEEMLFETHYIIHLAWVWFLLFQFSKQATG